MRKKARPYQISRKKYSNQNACPDLKMAIKDPNPGPPKQEKSIVLTHKNTMWSEFIEKHKDAGLCCWFDCYEIDDDTVPFPLPYRYSSKTDTFYVIGIFCSPECAKSYSANVLRGGSHNQRIAWIGQIIRQFYDYGERRRFGYAPYPREYLKKFHGSEGIDIKVFRRKIIERRCLSIVQHAMDAKFNLPPFVLTRHDIKRITDESERMAREKNIGDVSISRTGDDRIMFNNNITDDSIRNQSSSNAHRIIVSDNHPNIKRMMGIQ
jgi:hypothetical protein